MLAKRLGHAVSIVLVFGALTGVGIAQAIEPVTMDLGMDVAGRAQKVGVPLSLSFPTGLQISRISFDASFSGNRLKYLAATPTASAQAANLVIKADWIRRGEDDADSVLHVDVTGSSPLPAGELLKLEFEISETAQLNEDLPIKNLSQSAETPTGEKLSARGADGLVTVIEGAFFSCFFYMH